MENELVKPHVFCIDHTLWNSLSNEEVDATAAGLKEMGLYRLPYAGPIIVRLYGASKSHSVYQELLGIEDGGDYAWDHVIEEHRKHYGDGEPTFELTRHASTGDITVPFIKMPAKLEGRKAIYRFRINDWPTPREECRERSRAALIVLLATKGVNKKVHSLKRLKLGIGKNSSPYITTLSLSDHIQTGNSDEARLGHPVRPHLRRGHIRRQHYGQANQQIKKIWIDPIIVNADEKFISSRTAYSITSRTLQ